MERWRKLTPEKDANSSPSATLGNDAITNTPNRNVNKDFSVGKEIAVKHIGDG